ncbi:unnamed protein product [Spodoptera littoralis]|uniref:MD-2-related lipid-recognition domain-containing protein n=1 Tax=Spodoptera littoralis TaxID=7109 RepID=A0A9P0I965_SPOLI|nr:unnamed protein product [Spodoptera littoralis]CAH1641065.1 unnamed protein product [Spodoptera littoralis]
MLRVVAYVCALLALAHGQTTNVQSCTMANAPLPINAHIVGCVEPPCIIQQYSYVGINVLFRAPRNIQTMTTVATAHIRIPFPYPLGDAAQTCNYLTNSYCPLVEGEVVQYTLHMFIESSFPAGTSLPVEFRVNEGGFLGTPIWCIRVPLTIVPPLSSSNMSAGNATVADKV